MSKTNITTFEVIHMKCELPSFSWNDGLFFIVKEEDETLHMCKLDKDGQPELFEDGRFMITCTSKNNKGITKTNLVYRHENN